ncbi:TetR/AcrR family transcriptional regulator [Roseibium litorale]|uniref:TetR/AcrR family transcriptional regulator n=1 Tax=Roseibium litorale TaxID=2803841 RepID=A0ABR9CM64_9HYPH|nr:TetR/AcrR family transcriptional regulator [Roseibium litorale]MBD8891402.1 TetR/AcrR family transcriptional regulator [Roseibium litorale]
MATAKTEAKILSTFLDLLSSHSYEEVSLPLIAEEAGVKLSDLRASFGSRLDLIEAFATQIDRAVLDDIDPDMSGQPARERLFDVLMTRLDHLTPHKQALRTLERAAACDPGLLLHLNRMALNSQNWMLAAAGIQISGVKGKLVTQGLAISFARVVRVWLDEADEGMPRTMARLDKELDGGEDWLGRLNKAEKMSKPFLRLARKVACRVSGRRRSTQEYGSEPKPDLGGEDLAPASA